jgi:hypothetical protein
MLRTDSHQHFWRYDPVQYDWIGPGMERIARDWLPDDLLPHLRASGIDLCIAVQARTQEAETDFLLGLAAQHPWIAGVVGWTELREGDAASRLARWSEQPALKGMRHVLQGEADVRAVIDSPVFRRNVAAVQARGLVYELLVYDHQFAGLADFFASGEPSAGTALMTWARSVTSTVRCVVRFTIRNARPIGAGRTRFCEGPLLAWHFDTNKRATSPPNASCCCALATAERSTFATSRATDLRLNCNADNAWLTSLPRMRSSTSPAFCADVRMYLAVASARIMA